MVWRQQFGERGGVYGGWISKPGYDVTTCSPGDFLLDTNAQVFQCVLSGDSSIVTVGSPSTPAGSYSISVGLPGAFSAYSNLVVSVLFYGVNGGTVYIGEGIGNAYLLHNTVSGTLNLTAVLPTGSSNSGTIFRARWSVFRAQF